jgi:RNA polymerase sigma-70 factor (ECF subfamily)
MRQWLLKIATNQALSRQRRIPTVKWLQLAPDYPGPAMDTTEHVALVQGLATLPLRSRAAVVLHYYADLPVAEVATVMGTSQNTVKSQLRTGLARLREILDASVVTASHAEATNG